MSSTRCLDELLFWCEVISSDLKVPAARSLSQWEREFAAEMAKKGRWKNWKPTDKQEQRIRQLVRKVWEPAYRQAAQSRGSPDP